MFEKCIKCNRIGESCIPNLLLLPFPELVKWIDKRQRHLDWTSQDLADKSNVPVGTIKRIKAGEYMDCKYSTIKSILIALIGGTTDEFACTELVEKELQNIERLEQQATKLTAVEEENERLKAAFRQIDEQHRQDIRTVKEEYQEQITFLKDQLRAWQSWAQSKPDSQAR
jgi:hypothetical protein